jgi:hypothetical protein
MVPGGDRLQKTFLGFRARNGAKAEKREAGLRPAEEKLINLRRKEENRRRENRPRADKKERNHGFHTNRE